MKRIIAILIFVISLCGCLYYYYHSKKPYRCDAQLISFIDHGSSKAEFNLYAYIIISLHSEAVITLSGTMRQDDKNYIVSRTLYFTLQQSELDGVYKTKFTREDKGKIDEVPALIWQQYGTPRSIGIEFNSELKTLNKNAIFLQELSNPLFVCTKIE